MRDNGTYLGEAWFNMESYVETATFVEQRYPDRDPHTECAGNNLIGNPFLNVHYTGDNDTDNDKLNDRYEDYYHSKWSDRTFITMPKNKAFNFNSSLLERLFEQFLRMLSIIRHMLEM